MGKGTEAGSLSTFPPTQGWTEQKRGCPMHIHTKALILRDVNYKESDKILTLLTQASGKLTAAARGCRRKSSALSAGVQLLTWSDLVLFEYRGRWTVQEAAVEREFLGLRADVERLSLGCYFAEVAELLAVEEVPSPALLSLVLNSLHVLDIQREKTLPLVKAAFELRAMCLAGYEPVLDSCAVCGAEPPKEARFHLREGVLHCARCRAEVGEGISLPVSAAVLAAIRHIVYGQPKRLFSFRLAKAALEQLSGLCEAYLLTQLERGFRTLDFYKQMTLPMVAAPENK